MGSVFICNECGHRAEWDSDHAAGCAGTWHVYEKHPETWRSIFGDEPPRDPRPEQVGVQVPTEPPALVGIFRDCGECGGSVLVRWTPDGPDPAPTSCSQHSGPHRG